MTWPERCDAARAVGILDVVSSLNLGEARKRGRQHVFRCPLHDDQSPSLYVDPAKGVWYCHPCGVGGDALELWRNVRRLKFAEVVREMVP